MSNIVIHQLPALPDPIPSEYTWTIDLGEIKIGDYKQVSVEFPDNFFTAVKGKTYTWSVIESTNKQKHSCFGIEKTFNAKGKKTVIKLAPRCFEDKPTELKIQLQTRVISKFKDHPYYVLFKFFPSPNAIDINMKDIQLENDPFARGGEARLFSAVYRNQKVVVKQFFVSGDQKEANVLKKLRDPNVLEILGMFYDVEKRMNIVMRKALGSLDTFYLQYPDLLNVVLLQQLLSGLKYIHHNNYLHLDFKPQNVLLFEEINSEGKNEIVAKISDFGLCEQLNLQQEEIVKEQALGTYYYMAPEIYMEKKYSKKVDIFAFGRTVEVVLGRYSEENIKAENDLIEKTAAKGDIFAYKFSKNKNIDEVAKKVIEKCCQIDASKRISKIEEIEDPLNTVKIRIQNREVGIQAGQYKFSIGKTSVEDSFREVIHDFENNGIYDNELALKMKISQNNFFTDAKQMGSISTQLNKAAMTPKARGGVIEYEIGNYYMKGTVDEIQKPKEINLEEEEVVEKKVVGKKATKKTSGKKNASKKTTTAKEVEEEFKVTNEIKNDLRNLANECYLKSAQKANIESYMKIVEEMKRIHNGIKKGEIVEELSFKKALNLLIKMLKSKNPLLEKIETVETQNKEEITEMKAYKMLEVLSEVCQKGLKEIAEWKVIGKGTKMDVSRAQKIVKDRHFSAKDEGKKLKDSLEILTVEEKKSEGLMKELLSNKEGGKSNALILSFKYGIKMSDKNYEEILKETIGQLNHFIHTMDIPYQSYNAIKGIVDLAENKCSEAIETVIELIEKKEVSTWKMVKKAFIEVTQLRDENIISKITPMKMKMYYLIKGSYLLSKVCQYKLAETLYEESGERTWMIKMAISLLKEDVRIEKKDSLLLTAKCELKLGNKIRAIPLLENLKNQYSVEGVKLYTELQIEAMSDESNENYRIYRDQQKRFVEMLRKIDESAADELQKKGNLAVIKAKSNDLKKYASEIREEMKSKAYKESYEKYDILSLMTEMRMIIQNEEDLLTYLKDILKENNINYEAIAFDKTNKDYVLMKLIEFCLIYLSFENEDETKINKVALMTFGKLLRTSDDGRDCVNSFESFNILTKMGDEEAKEICFELASNKEFKAKMDRFVKGKGSSDVMVSFMQNN